jgi:hypothetical protein
MKKLTIPDNEKSNGIVWVEYQVIKEEVIVELKIQQEKN